VLDECVVGKLVGVVCGATVGVFVGTAVGGCVRLLLGGRTSLVPFPVCRSRCDPLCVSGMFTGRDSDSCSPEVSMALCWGSGVVVVVVAAVVVVAVAVAVVTGGPVLVRDVEGIVDVSFGTASFFTALCGGVLFRRMPCGLSVR